jgi:hypothetical protein
LLNSSKITGLVISKSKNSLGTCNGLLSPKTIFPVAGSYVIP